MSLVNCVRLAAMEPSISVVIPAYNASRYIRAAIESVLAQTCPPAEIIVIDDGSSDNTAQIVTSLGARVRYVHQENAGASAARNHGTKLAAGQYVAFLDADDAWEQSKLAKQVALLRSDPTCRVVHTDACLVDEDGNTVKGSANRRRQSRNGKVFEEFFEADMAVILTSTVLVARECFDTAGFFDETGVVVDDHDFFLRLAWHFPIHYIDEPLVRYRVLPVSLSRLNDIKRVQAHEATLQRAIDAHPEFFATRQPYLRKRRQRFHYNAAFKLLHGANFTAAHHHFRQSLPHHPKAFLYYALTAFPERLLTTLQRLKAGRALI